MTRKKFIKQLMALGLKRNSARRMAATANAEGLAYQDAYDKTMEAWFVRLLQRAIGESLAGAALVAGADGGLHIMAPQKCPADGFRADFAFVDELAAWPPEEGTTCR